MTGSEEVQSITCQELYERSQQGPVDLIDVRTPEEYAEVRAAIARNIPIESLHPSEVVAARQTDRDEPLYFICKIGGRSEMACQLLRAAGCQNVVNVAGGTDAWVEAGLPVEWETSR